MGNTYTVVVIGLALFAVPAFAQVHNTAPPLQPQTSGTPKASGQAVPTVVKSPRPNLVPGPGTISGVIWWDTKTVQTAPAPVGDVCTATGVTVVVHQTVRGQPLQSSVQVGSTPQWSSLMGSGNQDMKILEFGSVVACLFKITGLPVKTDLTVLINPSREIFLPKGGGNLPRGVGNVGTVNIPGGSCAAPPPQPTAIAQFTGPITYCGNGAYNVNFSLQPTTL